MMSSPYSFHYTFSQCIVSAWPSIQKVVKFFSLHFGVHSCPSVCVSTSDVTAVDAREAVSLSLFSPLAQGSSSIIALLFSSLSEGEVLGRVVKSMPTISSPLTLRNFLFLAVSCSCCSIALLLRGFTHCFRSLTPLPRGLHIFFLALFLHVLHLKVHPNSGSDIETASQMKRTTESGNGITHVRAMLRDLATVPKSEPFKCDAVSFINNISYSNDRWHKSVANIYRIYLCISRPFTTKKSAHKIALDLYTSHTQRPDQAVREISITTA